MEDLRGISTTCKDFNFVSWRIIRLLTKIEIDSELTREQISIFFNSKKTFENVSFFLVTQSLLDVLSQLSSIKLSNVIVHDLNSSTELLLANRHYEIKTIQLKPYRPFAEIRSKIDAVKLRYPKIKVYQALALTNNEGEKNISDLDDLNVIRIEFEDEIDDIIITRDNHKVQKLRCFDLYYSFRHFKKLKELCTTTDNYIFLQDLIEINKNTLTTLEMIYVDDWNYTLPCQLSALKVLNRSENIVKLLETQTYLRLLCLKETEITNELCTILSRNKFLRAIEFVSCKLKYSCNNFTFLQNVNHITIGGSLNVQLMYALITNCMKNTYIFMYGRFDIEHDRYVIDLKEINGGDQNVATCMTYIRIKYKIALKDYRREMFHYRFIK